MPDLFYEMRFRRHHTGLVCGVDEAGRGPLAGPVVAAAVILNSNNIPEGLDDSKVLSEVKRETLYESIWDNCYVGVGISEPEEIERANILGASLIAMRRAVMALSVKPAHALIDGNKQADLPCSSEAIIKGDSKSLSIAAASIVAKVTRDRLMVEAHSRFPSYGFKGHKGYPTVAHRAILDDCTGCSVHRMSFSPLKYIRSKDRR